MKVNRDQFFKTIQRMRKHLVRGQVDAWHRMIRLLHGQAQHSKQLEIQASASDVEWCEWIDAEFGPGDYFGPRDAINTAPDSDLTLARVGCEALWRTKDRFSDKAVDLNLTIKGGYLALASPQWQAYEKPVLLPRKPSYVQASVEHFAKIEPKALYALLAQVQHARGADETRPHLTGVELECTKTELRATTTDGHRLATATMQDYSLAGQEWTILLSGAAVDSLVASLRGCVDEAVELAVGSKALIVEGATFAVSTTALDAKLPPWRQVCPREDGGVRMVFGTDEVATLTQLIRQATKSAKGASANINGIFTFDYAWLTIQVVDSANPSKVLDTVRIATAKQIAGCNVPTLKTSFNLTYWQEAFDSIPQGTEITIQYDRELDPIAIYAGTATHVIMPCRL